MAKLTLKTHRDWRVTNRRWLLLMSIVATFCILSAYISIVPSAWEESSLFTAYTALRKPIRRIPRYPLQNFITAKHNANLCQANAKDHQKLPAFSFSEDSPIIPRCPREFTWNAVSAPVSRLPSVNASLPPTELLHPTTIHRILGKVLKYLFTNKGCEVAVDHQSKLIKDELFEVVKVDYQHELTMLTIGAHNKFAQHTSEQQTIERFLFDYFSDLEAKVNIVALRTDAEKFDTVVNNRVEASSKYPNRIPSSVTYCPFESNFAPPHALLMANEAPLSWVASDTFNVVLSFDYFNNFLPLLEERSLPERRMQVCRYLHNLLRVTKVGGAVWIGHITDRSLATLLSDECWDLDTISLISPLCDTERYGIEMTVLDESPWLWASVRSQPQLYPRKPQDTNVSLPEAQRKRRLTTTFAGALVASKPSSFIFRKSFLDSEEKHKANNLANDKIENIPHGKSVKINFNL